MNIGYLPMWRHVNAKNKNFSRDTSNPQRWRYLWMPLMAFWRRAFSSTRLAPDAQPKMLSACNATWIFPGSSSASSIKTMLSRVKSRTPLEERLDEWHDTSCYRPARTEILMFRKAAAVPAVQSTTFVVGGGRHAQRTTKFRNRFVAAENASPLVELFSISSGG